MVEYTTTLKCPKCGEKLVADIDLEAWATQKAYKMVDQARENLSHNDTNTTLNQESIREELDKNDAKYY